MKAILLVVSAGLSLTSFGLTSFDSTSFGASVRQSTFVEGVAATAQDPLLDTTLCQPGAEISYGDYALQNNTWNYREVYSDDWRQCIELTGDSSGYVASWDYNWLQKYSGNEYAVKSYPSVYYGRKSRAAISGTRQELGLPASTSQLPDFEVKYEYSETGSAERSVAIKSSFHSSCQAEEWNKISEMSVWVETPNTRSPGALLTEATIDGQSWDVHVDRSLHWGHVVFVAQQPSTEGSLDWNQFVDWARYEGVAYGLSGFRGNSCMGAIEMGTEIHWGQGTFSLHEFEVRKQQVSAPSQCFIVGQPDDQDENGSEHPTIHASNDPLARC